MKKNKFLGLIIILLTISLLYLINESIHSESNSTMKTKKDSSTTIPEKKDEKDYGVVSELKKDTISKGGNYDVVGSHNCITIHTKEDVQLHLRDTQITCDERAAITIKNAKSVHIILEGKNKIESSTLADNEGAIISEEELTFSGTGELEINSNVHGIVAKNGVSIQDGSFIIHSKQSGILSNNITIMNGDFMLTDSLRGIEGFSKEKNQGKITIQNGVFNIISENFAIQATSDILLKGGVYNIKTTDYESKGMQAGTLIEISGGQYSINTKKESISSKGNITINGGDFILRSDDTAITGNGKLEWNHGDGTIYGKNGIETTYIKINNGIVRIEAENIGIKSIKKSNHFNSVIEMNDGTLNIEAKQPFTYEEAKYKGGTIIINGQERKSISNE